MPYYPILVDIKGEKVVVVGGGAVAQRKIETLLQYGAILQVISKELTPELSRYVKDGKISLLNREFNEVFLEGAFMVIAATDDPSLNSLVSENARKKGLLINVVDQPSDCNFIVPSVLRRGDLMVTVSTSGKSPALAKMVREKLEDRFGNEYESFLNLMGRLREEILSSGYTQEERRLIFHKLVDSPILDTLGQKEWNEAALIINRILGSRLSPGDIQDYSLKG